MDPARRRVRAESLPLGGLALARADAGNVDVVPPADQLHLRQRLGANAWRGAAVREPREEGVGAAVAAPHREEIREPRLVRDVRIAVEGDVEAVTARRGDPREDV